MAKIEKLLAGFVAAVALGAAGYTEFERANMTPEQRAQAAAAWMEKIVDRCERKDHHRMGHADYNWHSGAFREACVAQDLREHGITEEQRAEGLRRANIIIKYGPGSESHHYYMGMGMGKYY